MEHTILIADDSDVFRSFEAKLLENRGFRVLHATDGAEAIKIAIAERPDLMLLDIQMPIVDGVQVLSTLKKNPETKDIKIIVVTTIGRQPDRELLLQGGAQDVIPKPVDGADLIRRVYSALELAHPVEKLET